MFQLLQRPPYEGMFKPMEPYEEVPPEEAPEYSPGRKEPHVGQAFRPDLDTPSGWKA
jgi:hypothetical protein